MGKQGASKRYKRIRRHNRVRSKITGNANRPRLSVFRSLNSLYLQLIDDTKGLTICQANTKEIKEKGAKTGLSYAAGKLLAERALKKDLTEAVFDRGGYKYHGRVKSAAEGARDGGLKI